MTDPTAAPASLEQLAAELATAKTRIAELTRELDDTNRGIIALHTDLEAARAAEARAVADQEVIAERDRIAAELHDQVIQKIFAAGMSLEGALGMIQNKVAAGRVRAVVADLDAVITQLRAAVFGAEEQRQAPRLRSQLNELATEARHALGYAPSLGFRGPIDETVPDDLAAALLAAVRVVLAVVPTTATGVGIAVEADTDLTLLVHYDGDPAPAVEKPAELESTAGAHGGAADVVTGDSGTRVTWRVPLPEPRQP